MVNFHVEATSKCTLGCPACDRTWFYNTFKKRLLHEIDVDDLVKFIGEHKEVNFCGNNGDPIYHSRFLELCEKLKEKNCQLHITTNGSSRPKKWWTKLSKILQANDSVKLSIDGLADTNHIYRKNSNWESILDAIKILNSKKSLFKTVWKFIIFKQNQHQIEEAKKLSVDLGFDSFKLEKSYRWIDNKDMMPDPKYVDDYYQHQQDVLGHKQYESKMKPNCLRNNKPENELYIDSEGNFYPCCWMGTYRYRGKSIFSPKQNNFNIKTARLSEILEHDDVKNFFESTKEFTSAHNCCKIHCGIKNG